ncbi:MAG: serine hydrolase, partial [Chitinivibrionales bacterium]|nr:serine hydrolase [Chitinivibrionales bacterium]
YDGGQAMAADDIFDVASITKLVPTSTLALQLIDRQLISADTPAADYLSELTGPCASQLRVRHLLTHTVDFGLRLSSRKDLPAERILSDILTAQPVSPPGSVFSYANATSLLLGILVERACDGRSLGDIAQRHLFEPLGMHDSTFEPDAVDPARTVPTERDPWRGREIRGEIHDESAWKLRPLLVPGSAGLFSTVPDLLAYLSMLLNGGEAGGERLLSKSAVNAMFTNQIAALDMSTGLGCELNQPRYMGSQAEHLIGKTGFTGCVVMCSRRAGRGLAFLSNATWPDRSTERAAIDAVRRDVADIVFGSA